MEHNYHTYFDNMPCYLTIQDRDLNIIEANTKFTDEFGKFEGRQCYQVYKQRPEKCEICPVEKTFRDGQCHQSEELVTTPDGRDVWVIVNTTPIRNGDGEITSVMEMSTDITDTKLLQNQFRDSQEKYKLLFEEVPCFISIQDKDLRITDANRLHRESFGTAYGSKCYEVYKHRDKECLPCIVRQTFEQGFPRTHEEVVTNQNNEQMNVLVYTAPLRHADGEIESVIEMSADITEIRKLQDKLTSVGLLIGSISHTIKGLLNGLDAGIYLVNTGLEKDDRDRVDQGWEIAMRNISRVRTMVLNILHYAKERKLEYENIKTEEFVKDVCKIIDVKSKSLDVAGKCNVNQNIGDFEADRQSIRTMLVNILENCLDACRTDTKVIEHYINVDVSGDDQHITFEISDNGLGMDRETREKAFSLFFSSKGAGGTGLGMFIADKIVKSHGGEITIESEQGEWSKFTVILPRKKPVGAKEVIELT